MVFYYVNIEYFELNTIQYLKRFPEALHTHIDNSIMLGCLRLRRFHKKSNIVFFYFLRISINFEILVQFQFKPDVIVSNELDFETATQRAFISTGSQIESKLTETSNSSKKENHIQFYKCKYKNKIRPLI